MELEKTNYMNLLYDFYGDLLTDKQKEYGELYYADDLSLREISEELCVSRQAVHDNIKRTSQVLQKYEDMLGLIKKEKAIKEAIVKLKSYVLEQISDDYLMDLIEQLEREV